MVCVAVFLVPIGGGVASRLLLKGRASMNFIRTKLVIAGVLLSGTFGYLAYAGMQSGWVYFVSVEQFASDTQFHNQRVRVHGKVATDGFDASKSLLIAKFNLTDKGGQSIPVEYHGVVPEMFEAGRDVVVEGRRDAAGLFQADVLMTKCASKYEPGSPHGDGANSAAKPAVKAEKQP
jgi:cytochrome c-type biogenesis protein CcmE